MRPTEVCAKVTQCFRIMRRQRTATANDTAEQMCRRSSLNRGKSVWFLGKDSVMYCAAKEEDSLIESNNDLRMSPITDGSGPYLLLLLVVWCFM